MGNAFDDRLYLQQCSGDIRAIDPRFRCSQPLCDEVHVCISCGNASCPNCACPESLYRDRASPLTLRWEVFRESQSIKAAEPRRSSKLRGTKPLEVSIELNLGEIFTINLHANTHTLIRNLTVPQHQFLFLSSLIVLLFLLSLLIWLCLRFRHVLWLIGCLGLTRTVVVPLTAKFVDLSSPAVMVC